MSGTSWGNLNMHGYATSSRTWDGSPVEDMFFPVRCTCGRVYDLGRVEVTARYVDCSMWKTPCCQRTTDDRPGGWQSGPGYTELRRSRR